MKLYEIEEQEQLQIDRNKLKELYTWEMLKELTEDKEKVFVNQHGARVEIICRNVMQIEEEVTVFKLMEHNLRFDRWRRV